jgi:hypothetical protein
VKRLWLSIPVLGFVLMGAACSCTAPAAGELRENEQKWAAHNISDYSYTLRIGCFCPQEITSPVVVEVRNRTTVSVKYVDSGQPASNSSFDKANTVEDLFAIVRGAISQKADKLTVEYDPSLGYPTQISIDPIKDAVDEETAYTVSYLKRMN